MRRVTRADLTAPEVLETDGGKGKTEREKAVAYFRKLFEGTLRATDKAPTFAAYKDKTVALALQSMFFGKCAYCESRYAGLHPVDIEHWRPKADVFDEQGKSRTFGYYWLAAAWENLLPSCIDCNRIRTHKDYLTKKDVSLGKGNWFPLGDEKRRARMPDGEFDEDPLLLNPCIDDPTQYFQFDEHGCVSPRDGLDPNQRKKAIASIQYYALNRTELVQDRLARLLLIKQKMNTISRLADILDSQSPDSGIAIAVEDVLAFELEALFQFQRPEEPFSEMAKAIIHPFMERFRPA